MVDKTHRYRDLWASDSIIVAWVISDVLSLAFIAVCTAHLNEPTTTIRKITMGIVSLTRARLDVHASVVVELILQPL